MPRDSSVRQPPRGVQKIVGSLGAGGIGEVYRALDTRLHRTVAIKVLAFDARTDPERRRRFQREAQSVAALSHPHIGALHDIGEHEGTDRLRVRCLRTIRGLHRQLSHAGPPSSQHGSVGGREPRWRHDGGELYFVSDDSRLMAAAVTVPGQASEPQPLFPVRLPDSAGPRLGIRHYDVARDGRFLATVVEKEAPAVTPMVTVSLNATAALRQRAGK